MHAAARVEDEIRELVRRSGVGPTVEPDVMQRLVDEAIAVLVAGGAVSFAAYRAMLRIARLPDDPRVLR